MASASDANGKPMSADSSLVTPIGFGYYNVYLVRAAEGHVLVDSGMPGTQDQLFRALEKTGIRLDDIRLLVATHGHLDHVGCMAHVKRKTGADLLAHVSLEQPFLRGEAEKTVARNLLGRVLNALTQLQHMNPLMRPEPVDVEVTVHDSMDLERWGVPGMAIHTPGHSQGSISLILDNGEAIVGDLVRDEGGGRLGFGMFYEDDEAIRRSLERVVATEPDTVYLSHGDRVSVQELREFLLGD